MVESKFFYALSESKNIFALEQKAIVSSFVKNVAFLLGHPLHGKNLLVNDCSRCKHSRPLTSRNQKLWF